MTSVDSLFNRPNITIYLMQINWLLSEACNKSGKQQEVCQRKVLLDILRKIVKQSLRVSLAEVSAFFPPTEVKRNNFCRQQHIQPSCLFFVTQFSHVVVDFSEKKKLEYRKHST